MFTTNVHQSSFLQTIKPCINMKRLVLFIALSLIAGIQIRFGTFLDAIPGWKGVSDPHNLLFPIPQEAINANDQLQQNLGY
jgi:hypothetical protein